MREEYERNKRIRDEERERALAHATVSDSHVGSLYLLIAQGQNGAPH